MFKTIWSKIKTIWEEIKTKLTPNFLVRAMVVINTIVLILFFAVFVIVTSTNDLRGEMLKGFDRVKAKLIPDQRKNVQVDKYPGPYQCFSSSMNNAFELNGFFKNEKIEKALRKTIDELGAGYLMLFSKSGIGKEIWNYSIKKGDWLPKSFDEKPFMWWNYNQWLIRYLLNNCSFEGIDNMKKYCKWWNMTYNELDYWLSKGYVVVIGTSLGSGHIITVKNKTEKGYNVIDTYFEKQFHSFEYARQVWVGDETGCVRGMVIIADFGRQL